MLFFSSFFFTDINEWYTENLCIFLYVLTEWYDRNKCKNNWQNFRILQIVSVKLWIWFIAFRAAKHNTTRKMSNFYTFPNKKMLLWKLLAFFHLNYIFFIIINKKTKDTWKKKNTTKTFWSNEIKNYVSN